MTPNRFVWRSLVHHRRMHAAVMLGVIAATAVLTGSLIVGDSMRHSLTYLTLDRLGPIDSAIVADRFFDRDLLHAGPDQATSETQAEPVILLRASLVNPQRERRANRVQLLGIDHVQDPQLQQWLADDAFQLEADEVTINQPLADQLGVTEPGHELLLRLPQLHAISGDSPLGDRRDTISRARLTIRAIVPAEGPGRFSMRADQRDPLNAWVSREWLQDRLDLEPEQVNLLLIAGDEPGKPLGHSDLDAIQKAIKPTLEDFGLAIHTAAPVSADGASEHEFDITSDQMMMPDPMRDEVMAALDDVSLTPVLTYLANSIRLQGSSVEEGIPYSTVTAIDLNHQDSLVNASGQMITSIPDGQVVLNRWAADDLGAKPGDIVTMDWFEPETTDGKTVETSRDFQVAAVCEMQGLGADPGLTPEVEGLTDKMSIYDWDPPFPFELDRIRDQDEAYWENYRATPKAFINRATGKQLWRSRFGDVTSLRVADTGSSHLTSDALGQRITDHVSPERLGFRLIPLKKLGLQASAGTTPFNVLFIAFSFFIIGSAVMLVGLLQRLGLEQRIAELGTLSAVGFERRRIARLMLAEALIVTLVGALLGTGLGIAYAAVMNYGLMHWWSGAVHLPLMLLSVQPLSLMAAYLISVVISALAIALVVRSTSKISVRSMLAGQCKSSLTMSESHSIRRNALRRRLHIVLLVTVIVASLGCMLVGEAMQAAAFFGVGFLALAVLLFITHSSLRGYPLQSRASWSIHGTAFRRLGVLSAHNLSRSPGRSSLCIALLASTTFLIVSISAFHMDPTESTPDLMSGNGGFALVAESDQPIYFDLNTPDGRFELGFPDQDESLLSPNRYYSLRVLQGDNASCLNLYQSTRPRVLGVPDDMLQRGGFSWAATAPQLVGLSHDTAQSNPWLMLRQEMEPAEDGTPRIPVVVDLNTANYALHMYTTGGSIDSVDDAGRPIQMVVVGFLNNSIFQGDLMTSQRHLVEHYPSIAGYRFFLVETPSVPDQLKRKGNDASVAQIMDQTLGDTGLTTETTGQRLASFLEVQNTYLSTFQSLGGLGLILGTFGLAAVQLRNILERRGELALLRAVGFTQLMLSVLVFIENSALLLFGLAIGMVASWIALLPHLLSSRATIPWTSLSVTLGAVLLTGSIAGLIAVRNVLQVRILPALRGD